MGPWRNGLSIEKGQLAGDWGLELLAVEADTVCDNVLPWFHDLGGIRFYEPILPESKEVSKSSISICIE